MKKKVFLSLLILGLALLPAVSAQAATTFYTDRDAWKAAVTSWAKVDLYSQTTPGWTPYDPPTPFTLPAGDTISFDKTVYAGQVNPDPTSDWYPWDGVHNPRILDTDYNAGSLTIYFSRPQSAFGFDVSPDISSGSRTLTLTLPGLKDSLSQDIYFTGIDHGCYAFFGWVGGSYDSMTLTIGPDTDRDFAIGRLVQGQAVPVPPSVLLLGSGLLGLAVLRRSWRPKR